MSIPTKAFSALPPRGGAGADDLLRQVERGTGPGSEQVGETRRNSSSPVNLRTDSNESFTVWRRGKPLLGKTKNKTEQQSAPAPPRSLRGRRPPGFPGRPASMCRAFCVRWRPGSLSTAIHCALLMDGGKNRTLRGGGTRNQYPQEPLPEVSWNVKSQSHRRPCGGRKRTLPRGGGRRGWALLEGARLLEAQRPHRAPCAGGTGRTGLCTPIERPKKARTAGLSCPEPAGCGRMGAGAEDRLSADGNRRHQLVPR